MVVCVGLTVIAAVVWLLLQVYVLPPLAVSVTLLPAHTSVGPVIVAVGALCTLTVCEAVAVQLPAPVTVTV